VLKPGVLGSANPFPAVASGAKEIDFAGSGSDQILCIFALGT